MKLTDLYVIDMESGKIHRVGDNPHDSLSVINGEVRYFNMQNGDGGGVNDGGYRILKTEDGCLEGEFGIIDRRFVTQIKAYLEGEL